MLDDPEAWAEAGLLIADALPDVESEGKTFTLEEASAYVRAAYAVGYAHAKEAKHPLSVEDARVAAARLRLAVPEEA